MIVVDTNVVAYFFIAGTHTDASRALWKADPEWRLPVLWRHEYLNILATYTRQGGTELATAHTLWQSALSLLAQNEREVDMVAALEVAAANDISAYDAQFVALAHDLGVHLVTEDRQLLRRFVPLSVPLTDYAEA